MVTAGSRVEVPAVRQRIPAREQHDPASMQGDLGGQRMIRDQRPHGQARPQAQQDDENPAGGHNSVPCRSRWTRPATFPARCRANVASAATWQ